MNNQVHLIEHSANSKRYICSDDSRLLILGEGFYLFQRISKLTMCQSPGAENKPCRLFLQFLNSGYPSVPHNFHLSQVSRWCWENCFRDHILRTNDLVQTKRGLLWEPCRDADFRPCDTFRALPPTKAWSGLDWILCLLRAHAGYTRILLLVD